MKNYSSFELEEAFETVWETVTSRNNSVGKPLGILIGGIPGSGKSRLVKMLSSNLDRNVTQIDIDAFRELHPRKHELYEKYGTDFGTQTNQFAKELAEMVFDKAIENHFNIIREGTLGNSSSYLERLKKLADNGYSISLHIIVENKLECLKSNIGRYEEMRQKYEQDNDFPIPRLTPEEKILQDASMLPLNAIRVAQGTNINELVVYNRESLKACNPLFDSKKDNTDKLAGILQKAINSDNGLEKSTTCITEYHPETIKLKEHLEKSAQNLTPKQREIYNSRLATKLKEFNQKKQHQAEQSKDIEK